MRSFLLLHPVFASDSILPFTLIGFITSIVVAWARNLVTGSFSRLWVCPPLSPCLSQVHQYLHSLAIQNRLISHFLSYHLLYLDSLVQFDFDWLPLLLELIELVSLVSPHLILMIYFPEAYQFSQPDYHWSWVATSAAFYFQISVNSATLPYLSSYLASQ